MEIFASDPRRRRGNLVARKTFPISGLRPIMVRNRIASLRVPASATLRPGFQPETASRESAMMGSHGRAEEES